MNSECLQQGTLEIRFVSSFSLSWKMKERGGEQKTWEGGREEEEEREREQERA